VSVPVERRFVPVADGEIHCAMAGQGTPVLLLHQTPRSWDEYRDVLPLLGARFRAIAMDTIGFGDSSKPPLGDDSIERWAAVTARVLDALGIDRTAVVGHHTGAVIAVELAASATRWRQSCRGCAAPASLGGRPLWGDGREGAVC